MQTKKSPIINEAGMEMLERHILKASNPSPTKEHDQLVWDEAKRYILLCIQQNFQVIQ
jgi:hypothetical protein